MKWGKHRKLINNTLMKTIPRFPIFLKIPKCHLILIFQKINNLLLLYHFINDDYVWHMYDHVKISTSKRSHSTHMMQKWNFILLYVYEFIFNNFSERIRIYQLVFIIFQNTYRLYEKRMKKLSDFVLTLRTKNFTK